MIENLANALNMTDKISLSIDFSKKKKHVLIIVNTSGEPALRAGPAIICLVPLIAVVIRGKKKKKKTLPSIYIIN